jgi:phosphohistidine swiveling domain-containing protein
MPAKTTVHCSDGTPIEFEWAEEGFEKLPFTWNNEHWTWPATPMDIALVDTSQPGWDRAHEEVGLTAPIVLQWVGPFQYATVRMPEGEALGEMIATVGKLVAEHGSAAGFWAKFCEPRAMAAVKALRGPLRSGSFQLAAEAHGYGLAQTFTSLAPLMGSLMPLRLMLNEHFGAEGNLLADEVTQGGENASQDVDREVAELAALAAGNDAVAKILGGEAGGRLAALRAEPGAAQFCAAFDAFIAKHAGRSFGWELALPTWGEDPDAVLAMVAAKMRAAGSAAPAANSTALRDAARARVLAQLPEPAKGQFQFFVGALDGLVAVRENRAYWQMTLMGAMRLLLLERGAALVAAGSLDAADDIFFLTPEEWEQAPSSSLKQLARSRRDDWERFKTLTPPHSIGAPESEPRPTSQQAGQLRGYGVSRGLATGHARIIGSPEDIDRFEEGDILVCRITTPAWTPLFGLAAAVVTETGSALSHPAITSREYGIPCVLSVQEATRHIRDGQMITVDGEHGTVELL